jgi:hypothetical protein
MLVRHLGLTLALPLLAVLYGAWTWTDSLQSIGNDSTIYLMTARHFAPWIAADPIWAEAAANSQFPPVFALLLMLTGAADNLLIAHQVTTVGVVAALAMLYAWSTLAGLPRAVALLLLIVCAGLPLMYRGALLILPEPLYLALSLGMLAALVQHRRSDRASWFYVAAAVASVCVLTRTVGVALYAPLLVGAWRSRRRGAWLAMAVSLVPIVLWQLLHRPEHAYGTALSEFYGGPDPLGKLWRHLPYMAANLFEGLRLNIAVTPSLQAVTAPIAAASLLAAAWRALKLEPDGVYVVGYLMTVLLWPFPLESKRFLLVAAPVLLGQLLLVMSALTRRLTSPLAPLPAPLLAVALIACIAPDVARSVQRLSEGLSHFDRQARFFPEWYEADLPGAVEKTALVRAHLDALERIGQHVGADECVVVIKRILVQYHAHRRAYQPAIARVPQAEFDAGIQRAGCGYVFATSVITPDFPDAWYPIDRIPGDKAPVEVVRPWHGDRFGKPVAVLARLPK